MRPIATNIFNRKKEYTAVPFVANSIISAEPMTGRTEWIPGYGVASSKVNIEITIIAIPDRLKNCFLFRDIFFRGALR